jgi:hypothetical protein
MEKELPGQYDADTVRNAVTQAQAQNSKYAMFTTLPQRVTGLLIVRTDETLPSDHGLLDTLWVVEDLREKGYTEQAIGEGIDLLRRNGCRYLVVKERKDPHIQLLLNRFCFEPMGNGLHKMELVVPGLNEPVY